MTENTRQGSQPDSSPTSGVSPKTWPSRELAMIIAGILGVIAAMMVIA